MRKHILISLMACAALYSADFTYKGKKEGEAEKYLRERKVSGATTNLGYDFKFPGYSENKLTFDYDASGGSDIVNPKNVETTTEDEKDVHHNYFTMKNGKFTEFGYAGISSRGRAYYNIAVLKNGSAGEALTGGFSNFNDVYNNEVVVEGGSAKNVYGGQTGNNTGKAYNNKAIIIGGEVENAYGAGEYATTDNAGDMYNNGVEIKGGKITGGAFGASNEKNNSAYNNYVLITGGNIEGSIIGSTVTGKKGLKATGNTVTIDGSKYIVGGNIAFSKDKTILYGGRCSTENINGKCESDVFSGNTLNIKNIDSLQVKDIKNFEFINFYLSSDLDKSKTIISLSDGSETDLSKTKIGVMMNGGINKLELGDSITLIDKTSGSINPPANLTNTLDDKARTIKTVSGVSKIYTFTLKTESKNQPNSAILPPPPPGQAGELSVQKIIAEVSEVSDNPKQKNIAETSAMMGGMVNEGGELATGMGLKSAVGATQASGGETASFGSMGGQNVRLNSGSHVDVKGFSVIVGVSKQANDMVTYGAFVETGIGNYDSYNDFGNAGSAKGEGKSKYLGTGLMAKFDLTNGYYTEASIRGGKIWSDYKSNDVNPGVRAEFKSSRIYWGTHLGFGKIFEIDDSQNIDAYTKFYLTRLNTDTIKVLNEKIKFHNSNSVRARIGARYNKEFSETISGYAGAAFEREFNSDAKSTNLTQNEKIKAPSLKGNTAIGELGMKIQTKYKPLKIDFNLQGLGGKREGVTGGVNFEFKF